MHTAKLMEVPKIGKYMQFKSDYAKDVLKSPGFVAHCDETGAEAVAFPGDGWGKMENAPEEMINRVVFGLDIICWRDGHGHTHTVPTLATDEEE